MNWISRRDKPNNFKRKLSNINIVDKISFATHVNKDKKMNIAKNNNDKFNYNNKIDDNNEKIFYKVFSKKI
jgi:hypothetical protein